MKKLSFMAVWILALLAIACALLVYDNDLLWKVQEMNLFLNTSLYFKQQMVTAGGMLTYLGTFFTQFLYHPAVGVTMLCAWWLLMMALARRAFQVPGKWAALMLIPVALILLTIVDMGYWVYLLKLRGHFFVTTIGCTAVAALMWCFRCLPTRWLLTSVFLAAVAVAGYPLMGIYALAAVLLMAIWSWRLYKRGTAILHTCVALVCIVAVPLLYYHYVYYQTNITNIYFTELPLYYLAEEYHQYYIPYYLLLLFFVAMACVPWPKMKTTDTFTKRPVESSGQDHVAESISKPQGDEKKQPRRMQGRQETPKKQARQANEKKQARQETERKKPARDSRWLRRAKDYGWTAGIVALLACAVAHFWYKDSNFRRELRMQHCIERLDWEGVVSEAAAQTDEPTRAIVMMKNLALSRLGRQSTEMYKYRNGSKASNAPFGVRMMQVVGMLIYYQYGKINDCARLAMEMGVEYDWRVEYYKYLTRCAILDGDKPLAKKYIHILRQTTYYKEWADKAERLTDHPGLIAKDQEMEPITHMLHYPDELGSDQGYVEKYLMQHLAHTNYTGDPLFQEQCLIAAMWIREPQLFWYQFHNYIRLHPGDKMPPYYQQAAYTFGVESGNIDLERMPFDPGVKDIYERFSQDAANLDGRDITEAREMLYPLYGDTYFYDYYLMSDLPQY